MNGQDRSVGVLLADAKPRQARALALLLVGRAGRAAAHRAPRRRRLHQLLVRAVSILVQQDVQGLLVNAGFREFDLDWLAEGMRWEKK